MEYKWFDGPPSKGGIYWARIKDGERILVELIGIPNSCQNPDCLCKIDDDECICLYEADSCFVPPNSQPFKVNKVISHALPEVSLPEELK